MIERRRRFAIAAALVVLVPLFGWLLLTDDADARSLRVLESADAAELAPAEVPAPPAFALHARWLSEPAPRVVTLGRTVTFSLEFENTGTVPWIRGTPAEARLGVIDDDPQFADAGFASGWPAPDRVAVQAEHVVEPGATGHFTFHVRGAATGSFRIPLRPLVEDVAWMEDDGAFVEFVVR